MRPDCDFGGGNVKKNVLSNALLGVIAMALVVIAARPYVSPVTVAADSAPAHAFYIEPGVQNLRYPDGTGQVYGKVVVDLRSGKIWGSDWDCGSLPVVSAG